MNPVFTPVSRSHSQPHQLGQARPMLAVAAWLVLGGCATLMPLMAPKVQTEANISAAFPFESKFVTVNGSQMHYVETGEGLPVVFVHGNPTSSYLWRNVLPGVGTQYRAIAVDLIGMGKSDKPPLGYHLEDHISYFDGFMQQLGLGPCVLVLHDWGGPIGLDYAMRHSEQVLAMVLMETTVRPMTWGDFDMGMTYMFKRMRDPQDSQQLIVRDNYFVEKMLPMMSGRALTAQEMTQYRAPFLQEKDRLPVAVFPKEIPLDGQPAGNYTRMAENYTKLLDSHLPLLLLRGRPGALIQDAQVTQLKRVLPRLTVKDIGPGIHFLQEAQPTAIGVEILKWLGGLESVEHASP